VITPTLILPHQGGGEFLRELDAPQLCCGVLHFLIYFADKKGDSYYIWYPSIHKVLSKEMKYLSEYDIGPI
jgi:hypothetical protein